MQDIRREALEEMKSFNDQFTGVLEMNGLLPTDLKTVRVVSEAISTNSP